MSPTILIIDDHPEFRELLSHHISAEWPRATIIEHDLDDFPDLGRLNTHVDVILLDYLLEGEDGLNWLERLRANPDCPPVVFLTAAGDELLAVRAIKSGAHDYLPKSRMTNSMLVKSVRDAMLSRNPLVRAPSLPPTRELPAVREDVTPIRGYRIISAISERGTSAIYLAEHEGDEVALKVLSNAGDMDNDKLERFLQECEVVSDLRHRNIVRIFDHGVADEVLYIAMEYFPRGDLKAWIGQGLSVPLVMECVRQIATALDAIHEVGILHRDLKPANVMVREDHTLALIDFGHAKQMTLEAALTETGEVFGTPYYMSPEQGQGQPTDARSDIYSLGILLFEMLTGRKPYTAASPMAVLYKHSHAKVPQLPKAYRLYQSLLNRMLAKDPAARFQSAAELLATLDGSSDIADTSRV